MKISKLVKRYRVGNPDKFRLSDIDPADTCDLDFDKDDAKEMLAEAPSGWRICRNCYTRRTSGRFFSIFQAMDAAGKDGVIKHVMSGINPQGCEVHAFKAPTAHELDHDFMWRCAYADAGARPDRCFQSLVLRRSAGRARASGISRTPETAAKDLIGKDIWDQRYKTIRAFERHPRRTARRSSNSICAYPRKSSASVFSTGLKSRPSAGNSTWAMSPSASCGTNTWMPTRT